MSAYKRAARAECESTLDQRAPGRDVMADDLPISVFAHDHPGDLDRQVCGALVDHEVGDAGDIDHIVPGGHHDDIRELHLARAPFLQAVKIRRHTIPTAKERRL